MFSTMIGLDNWFLLQEGSLKDLHVEAPPKDDGDEGEVATEAGADDQVET